MEEPWEELKKSLHNIKDERKRLERIWSAYRDSVEDETSKLCYEKDAAKAESLKNHGNHLYSSKKYREALVVYNQALCKAPKDSPLLCTLYANRSVVYLVTHRPLECLENIEWALKHGYPTEQRDKFVEMSMKCAEMTNVMTDDEIKPSPKPILKPALSHPAHPKFPFLSKAVDIVLEPNVEPQLIAKRNLRAGDTFFMDPYSFRLLDAVQASDHSSCCAFCLLPAFLSLIPCDGCAKVMFCKECLPKSKPIHRLECGFSSIEKYDPLFVRSLVQILDLYRYDFEMLKQDISECQNNPGSVLEGDYVNDLERQVVRWIFARWKQLDLDEYTDDLIGMSSFLDQLLLNPSFKAVVDSFDKEVTVLQILFSFILLGKVQNGNGKLDYMSIQPIQCRFLAKDEREGNAHFFSSDHSKFTYCTRPVKAGSVISLVIRNCNRASYTNEQFLSAVSKTRDGNEKPFYDLMQKIVPESHKTPKNLNIPNFKVALELCRIMNGDLQAKKRFLRILNDYDRHFPCLELAVVVWLYEHILLKKFYRDKDYENFVYMIFK